MAQEILTHFSKQIPQNSILVPIPLHWSRLIWRGYNQAQKLAQSLKKTRPDLTVCIDLKRTKKTKQQAALSKKERANNMKNVFKWNGDLDPTSNIFLIDDVFTSGATMHAAQEELQKQNYSNIKALSFARTK